MPERTVSALALVATGEPGDRQAVGVALAEPVIEPDAIFAAAGIVSMGDPSLIAFFSADDPAVSRYLRRGHEAR